MNYTWLHRTGSRNCILFFTGWGMDAAPFGPMGCEHHDILMVYDYRALEPLDTALFADYDRLDLVAWSMGVWVAGHLLGGMEDSFASRIAVGGTLDPVHSTLGIPTAAYLELEHNFCAERLTAFHDSMFTDQTELELFASNRPRRALDEVGDELTAFRQHYEEHGRGTDIYTHKIVTTRDRVYPLKNQRRAWGKDTATILKLPHFPFYSLGNWRALLDPDT